MPQQQNTKNRIKCLEQELKRLQHCHEADRESQINDVEQELQPLYEQLGGEYVSVFNFNYRKNSDDDHDHHIDGLW